MPVGAVGLISVMLLLVPPPLDWPPPPDFDASISDHRAELATVRC